LVDVFKVLSQSLDKAILTLPRKQIHIRGQIALVYLPSNRL
jgi:hypothetical protein